MGNTHLVIPDAHAHPDFNNDRADWLSNLIRDVRPDVVIDIGDSADMPSLCSYDKGRKSFQGRTYRRDIDAYLDFQERLWGPIKKAKKKLPRRIRLIGNHEQRIEKAIELQPELENTIGFKDLKLEDYYDDIVYYKGGTPGTIEVDGITYSHYLISGVLGRPIGGEHTAYSMVSKMFSSCTVGHSHTFDYCVRNRPDGSKVMGLVAGVFQDYDSAYAGEGNKLWHRGVIVKRNVDRGAYDLETVSIDRLRGEYAR